MTLRSVVSATTVLLLVQIFRCHRIEIRLEKVKCRLYKARVERFSERSRALNAAAACHTHSYGTGISHCRAVCAPYGSI